MAGLFKELKRSLRRKSGDWLHRAIRRVPPRYRTQVGPALYYVEMLILDYGITRIFYNNRHRISADAWRSAQPAPHHIRWIASQGVKTVLNLRGDRSFGTVWLEEKACSKHGLKLVSFKMRSRVAPSREDLLAVRKLLREIQYPVLIHCKSGADRAGLMSVLYRHEHDRVPIEAARNELHLKYGHIRQAETGVLDYVFERYLADNAKSPIEFWSWVETKYDADEVNRTFKSSSFANRLVNNILKRE